MTHHRALVFLGLISLGLAFGVTEAQEIRITSPKDGTIFHPGETVVITVAADPQIQGVIVASPTLSPIPTANPMLFTLAIPREVRLGPHYLRALGVTKDRAMAYAPEVNITIEAVGEPTLIEFDLPMLVLQPGHDHYAYIRATFEDELKVDVTKSSKISFRSDNPNVATVGAEGKIVGVSAGETVIWAEYQLSPDPRRPNKLYAVVVTEVEKPPYAGPKPVIDLVEPSSGVPGRTSATIRGHGFGDVRGNGTVELGNQNATNVQAWSDKEIKAIVPEGSFSGLAVVSNDGHFSNGVPFRVLAPEIDSVSPTDVSSGAKLTIHGSEFGAVQTKLDWVEVHGIKAVVTKWTNTEIEVIVPKTSSESEVYVHQNGLRSNLALIDVAP